ncbi:MAG: hypothetical protein JO250_06455 [Armatimonadetes bacterium]|nr:hypothetical protein [Armatimonadota bacterium]
MKFIFGGLLALILLGLCLSRSLACACGCGVFDVGDPTMFPHDTGGIVFLEYDYMDQNRNWSGTSRAPAANNDDKDIRTNFWTAGAQYMFNRKWGVMAEVPYWQRHFETTDEDTGDIVDFDHAAFGDIRLRGIYTGFSPDMSTGVTFGLKLANGDHTYAGFDPDTSIGTGSTDLLLGAFHSGALTADNHWDWFVNGQLDLPFQHVAAYRPGNEVDGIGGIGYRGWSVGKYTVAPLLQLVGSYRERDGGPEADPPNSGYERLLLTPGIQVHAGSYTMYADVGLPVYQNVNGNQLTAAALFKINISHDF